MMEERNDGMDEARRSCPSAERVAYGDWNCVRARVGQPGNDVHR